MNFDTGSRHFVHQVRHQSAELCAAGQQLREQRLAAQSLLFLVQDDSMAPLRGDDGGLHARRASSHDHHPATHAGRRNRSILELTPAHRILYA